MPKVNFVKKARKANSDHGIKKGESYYWWKFRFGGKRVSKTPPRRSQLTQSEYYGAMFDAEDVVEDAIALFIKDGDADSLRGAIEEARNVVDEQMNECDDKASNLENAFPNGCPTLELLQQRRDACENISSCLDSAEGEVEDYEPSEGKDAETEDEYRERIAEAVQGQLDWSCE